MFQDKTFGLKNKKGKKQQTYIKNVQNQVSIFFPKKLTLSLVSQSKKKEKIIPKYSFFVVLSFLINLNGGDYFMQIQNKSIYSQDWGSGICLVYYFLETLYVVAKEPNMVLLSLRFLENA